MLPVLDGLNPQYDGEDSQSAVAKIAKRVADREIG